MRILAIQTFKGANDTVWRHYPFYEKCGADRIIGITTLGGKCRWPTLDQYEIGKDSYVDGPHLCERLLDTIDWCLSLRATEIIVAEYDTLFFREMPKPFPSGLVMNRTGGGGDGFKGAQYYHGPWCMNAETAREVVTVGRDMIMEGEIERGWPDRFIGWLAEFHKIPVVDGFFQNYTQNALDRPQFLEEARAAILSGAHAVHGCKTPAQLEYITG